MEQNIEEKTGKTLEQWKAVLTKKGFSKHGEMMTFLKSEHGITHGYANLIVLKFREADAASSTPQDLVSQQYEKKETLLPIYHKLQDMITLLGEDIEVAPKKSSVSFRRKRQFALVQPSTKTRIDLGLKFNDRPCEGRLEGSGPFGAMCTHRVQLTDLAQVDDELKTILAQAYEEAG